MTKKLKSLLLTLAAVSFAALPVVAVSPAAYAQVTQSGLNAGLCSGTNFDLNNNQSATCTDVTQTNFNTLLTRIINIFSAVVGVIAVIMIIVGGLRYITSGGDTSHVSTAKTTIIYALVGLVIVALAQLIVHFVLNTANNI